MVIPSNSWSINNMIMSMLPEVDLFITVLPFSILVTPARGTNLVSASLWSLDFSVTAKATCWIIFRQWLTFEKYVTLSPTFFFPSFYSTSIRLNNVSLLALFLRKLNEKKQTKKILENRSGTEWNIYHVNCLTAK